MGVPTHAMDIQAEQARRGIARLGAVNLFYMAGAPIPAAVAERFVAQGVRPQNIYGMTENSSHQYTHPTDDETTICTTRSEEHTSELQSLMRTSYAVFCLQKKHTRTTTTHIPQNP